MSSPATRGHRLPADPRRDDDIISTALLVLDGKQTPTEGSRRLLHAIGGRAKLLQMTEAFYREVFANPTLRLFWADEDVQLHAERLAAWIAEKLGSDQREWTASRASRTAADTAAPENQLLVPRNELAHRDNVRELGEAPPALSF